MIPYSSTDKFRGTGTLSRQQGFWQSSRGSPNWRAENQSYRQSNNNFTGSRSNNNPPDSHNRNFGAEGNIPFSSNYNSSYNSSHRSPNRANPNNDRAYQGGHHYNRQMETRSRFPTRGVKSQNQHSPSHRSRDNNFNKAKSSFDNKGKDNHDSSNVKVSTEKRVVSYREMEAPKAYAPLGYGVPKQAIEISKFDYDNDIPLPEYPERPSVLLDRGISCTFVDTEMVSNNINEKKGLYATRLLTKKPKLRFNALDYSVSKCMPIDPAQRLVSKHRADKQPITLGKYLLEEDSLTDGHVILDKMLKRNHLEELGITIEDSGTKKKRLNDSLGEAREDNIYNTVSPEKVLRMVDSGLIDDSPKNKYADHHQLHQLSQLSEMVSGQGKTSYISSNIDYSTAYLSGFYDEQNFKKYYTPPVPVIPSKHERYSISRPNEIFTHDKPYYQPERSTSWKDTSYTKFKSEDTPSKSKSSTVHDSMTDFY